MITPQLLCCHQTSFSRANVSFNWLSIVQIKRGDTAIEKHLRLQKQADDLAEKIDFNECVDVLRTPELAVTQARKLFESRGCWNAALQYLMESSKQERVQTEKDEDEYSESTVDAPV